MTEDAMTGDPHVPPPMWARIQAALEGVAAQEGVRLLLAIESGSRAWRFPSPDSDYDVRFLYVRPRDAYLSVAPLRDVIEQPIAAALDLGGWDLRKALGLMLRSNAVLLEWLASPVRYRGDGGAVAALRAFAHAACDLGAVARHYEGLARRAREGLADDGPVRLKTYCYALRPALALCWIRRHGTPPPMDVPALLDGVIPSPELRAAIDDVIRRKAGLDERGLGDRVPTLDAWLETVLAVPVPPTPPADRAALARRADALFRDLLAG